MSIISRYLTRKLVPVALLMMMLSACVGAPQAAVTPQPTNPATTNGPVATTPTGPDLATATLAPTTVAEATTIPQATAAQVTVVTPTTQPTTAPVADMAVVYVNQNVLFSQSVGGGPPRQIAEIVGTFHDVKVVGDVALILLENGIERVELGDGTRTQVVTFDIPAQSGSRLLPTSARSAVYTARYDDPNAPFGKTLVGSYTFTDGTSKELLNLEGNAEPLGLTADGTGLYLLPRGQDPSFVMVQVVDMASGALTAELPIEGEGQAVLAPDGRTLATTARRLTPGNANDPGQDLIYLYDLNVQPPVRREIALSQAPSAANSLVWSPDSRTLYFLLGRGNLYELTDSLGLWRLDVATEQAVQVSDADLRNSWIIGISPNGTRALVAHPQEVAPELLDLTTGTLEPFAVPGTAFLVGWHE